MKVIDLTTRVETIQDLNLDLKQPNGSIVCPEGAILSDKLVLVKRIGSDSVNGEVIKTCYPLRKKEGEFTAREDIALTVKKIPLSPSALKNLSDHTSKEALNNEIWNEIMIMKLSNAMVKDRICPNLPMFLKYYFCETCHFSNPTIVKKYKADKIPCVLLINELASGGDLKNWCATPRNNQQWATMFFQVFTGLLAMQKYFNMTHHDLHWGNILVHRVKPGYIRYKINGKKYYIYNHGYLFVLWDFGLARIPGKIEAKDTKKYYERPDQQPRLLIDYARIANTVRWTQERGVYVPQRIDKFFNYISTCYDTGKTLEEIIPTTFAEYTRPSNSGIHTTLQKYSLDKKLVSLPEKYQWLIREDLAVSEKKVKFEDIEKIKRFRMEDLTADLKKTDYMDLD